MLRACVRACVRSVCGVRACACVCCVRAFCACVRVRVRADVLVDCVCGCGLCVCPHVKCVRPQMCVSPVRPQTLTHLTSNPNTDTFDLKTLTHLTSNPRGGLRSNVSVFEVKNLI